MRILLIRHGRQDSTLCNVDVPLAEAGRRQAELAGRRLSREKIDVIYSSQLIRAKETADIINRYVDAPRVVDERFQEANFGDLTGLSTEELKSRYGAFLDVRAQMKEDLPYPGGGENGHMVYERSMAALRDLVKQDYECVAVVTHGGVLRALLTGLLTEDLAKWLTFGRQIENTSITELLYDEASQTFHIERFNDYAHLESHDELLRKHFSQGFFHKD